MNRIRELRRERKWRQEDLSRELQSSRQAIGNYETGERTPDLDTILKLCEIFDVSADYLLGRSEIRSFELSADEAALLTSYRGLSETGKEYVRHSLALAGLAHAEKNGDVSALETAE